MKKFTKAISIILTVIMVLSAILVGVSAESTVTVNGTELKVNYYYGTNNTTVSKDPSNFVMPTTGEVYTADNDESPLVPGLPSTRLTYGWNKDGNTQDAEDIKSFYEIGGTTVAGQNLYRYIETGTLTASSTLADAAHTIDISDENSGLMFYIKLGATSKDTGLYIESQSVAFDENDNIVVSGTSYVQLFSPIMKSQPVYLMPAGTDTWTEISTNDATLGIGGKSSNQAIALPGGYEGWIYLPRNSYINTANSSRPISDYKWLYRLNFYFNELTYDNEAQFSNIMIVDGDVTAADAVTVGDITYNFSDDRYFSAEALAVGDITMSYDGIYDIASADGQNAQSYGADSSALYPTVGSDYSGGISPDSYYTVVPTDQSSINVRPTANAQWLIFKTTKNGRLYDVEFNYPDPLSNTTRYPSYEADGVTPSYWKEKHDAFFNEDHTAYIGGIYQDLLIKNSDDATTTVNHPTQVYITSTSVDITNKSVLVYFNHTYADGIAQEDKKPMHVCFQLDSYFLEPGETIYSFDKNTGSWTADTLLRTDDTMVQGQMGSNNAYVEVPVDFEGWYLLPAEAFKNISDSDPTAFANFKVCPDSFGAEFGEFTFGEVSVVDNFDPASVSKNSIFASTNDIALASDFPFDTTSVAAVNTQMGTIGTVAVPAGINKTSSASSATITATEDFSPAVNDGVLTYGDLTSVALFRIEVWTDSSKTAKAQLGTNKSVILRVKNDSDTDTVLLTGNQYAFMAASKPYYLLADGATKWSTETTSSESYKITINNANYTGYTVTIPAGFEGIISLPLDSISSNSYTEYYRFPLFPVSVSGSVTFSNFALSTELTPSYYTTSDTTDTTVYGMNAALGDKAVYSYGSEEALTVADGVLSTESELLFADLKVSGSIKAGGALMFYAKNTAASDIAFKTSIGDNTAAKGYSVAGRAWTSLASDGKIVLPAGFEGWVKIAVGDAAEFDLIRLNFFTLADGLALSDFMALNQSDDLTAIRRGTKYATGLFYSQGDFNLDTAVDICDLVKVSIDSDIVHDVLKFTADDQSSALRVYILNK